jgi:hypothetical protein
MSAEVWKAIPSIPEYAVSNLGRVRREAQIYGGQGSRRPAGHILRERALPTGHRQVTVSVGNVPRTFLVHRLVASAFLPDPADGKDCVLHRDDDPSNNRPENLFWGNRADNSRDKVEKCRQAVGERVSSAKLTREKVLLIRQALAAGEKQRVVADRFGVTQTNVSMIASRTTWRYV